MKKRLIAMLLSFAMVVSLLAGCGKGSAENGSGTGSGEPSEAADTGTESGDLPTITMMVVCGSTPTETNDIAAKLSEITSKKIGCNVDLLPIEIGNLTTQLNLLLSGGDDTLDVYMAMDGLGVPFSTVVNNGQALDMAQLMEPYAQEMKAALGENVYNSGYVNGKLYGIGRLLDQATTTMFNIRADIAAENGYKNGDKITLDELNDMFAKIRKKYPDTPIIGPMNGSINFADFRVDQLGNNLGVLGNYGQDDKVTNYYDSKEYEELVGYFEKWKEMGVYMPDLLNVTDAPVDYIPAGKAFGCWAGHFSAEMNGIWATQNFGVEIASLQVFDDAVAVTPSAYECINPATKYPEQCAGLIHLLTTDPDVVNLLVNGIEGVDYQMADDGSATYVDGKDVSSTGWCMGYSWANLNSTLSVPFNYPADYFDQLKSANANAKQSKAFGCQFDLTSVSDEVSACTNVVNQYANAIAAGAVNDYAGTLADFQKALKDAGIDKIVSAKQEQLDAYLANK
ncbi:MAG TPA: ABC transporter substrate-binding protein [Mobilitalea sp.]|nr:ABC transporter substrate-binding protein [Mobilitalea sp.]